MPKPKKIPKIEERLDKHGKVHYRAKVRKVGYPSESKTFSNLAEAKHWLYRVEADIHDDKHFPQAKAKRHTVADLIDAYLEFRETENPRRHKEIKPLLSWWKSQFGFTKLANFSSEQIIKAQQKLMNRDKERKEADGTTKKLSPATVNRHLVALHTAIEFGVRPLKWIATNPVDDTKLLKEPPGRTRFLSESEIDLLLDACKISQNPLLFTIVMLGIATGSRRAELERMKWVDLSDDGTRITLPKTKNNKVRSAYLSGSTVELVQRLKASALPNAIYLFPSPNTPLRTINFESAWRKALERAGIMDFRFHDLRHTCGSYLAMNGASGLQITEVLGQSSLQMAQRYAHLTQGHTSSLVAAVAGKVLGHVEI